MSVFFIESGIFAAPALQLDMSHLKSKICLIAFIVAAGLTSVLLHGCIALLGDAGSDAITDHGQLPDEPIQTPGQIVDPGAIPNGSPRGDWARIQAELSAGKDSGYQPEKGGFVSSDPIDRREIHHAAGGATTRTVVDGVEVSYPLITDPRLQQQTYLKAFNINGEDTFTGSVAISGNALMVGASGEKSSAPRVTGEQIDNPTDVADAVYEFSSFSINAGLNGFWWNGLARDGEGVQIEVSDGGGGSQTFVATFYGYDTSGNQIFLVAIGTVNGDTAEVDVFITEGGVWSQDFDPSQVNTSQWGTGTFTASSCSAVHMTLTPNAEYRAVGYTDLSYDLIRLTTPLIPCPIEPPNWPHYGGGAGGTRYSPLDEINRGNVANLEVAWTYRTGDFDASPVGGDTPCNECHGSDSKFEATPILNANRLYLSTPLNRVIALNPASGQELWSYDPGIKLDVSRSEGFVSRGVSFWQDSNGIATDPCYHRIFMPTVDARLIALDAITGEPCQDFGDGGTVRLDLGVGDVQEGQYGVTSPPPIVGDAVIVGSAIGDNRAVELERGTVRAFDARSGDLLWSFDPIPRSPDDPAWDAWTEEGAERTGAANAWAPLSADLERDMVFVPTGSASPDHYGGERRGDNPYANAVVALRASTGEMLWYFQAVKHDLWDYDIASQPALVRVPKGGKDVPAVAVATKMGFLFILDRLTGEPLFPVEERRVPAASVEGEAIAVTQTFPVLPPPLHPLTLNTDDVWGLDEAHEAECRSQIEGLLNQGIYTPPSLQGSIAYPGFLGGMNWGSMAYDEERSLLVTGVNRLPLWVRLTPRPPGPQSGNMIGTPYTMTRQPILTSNRLPCTRPPWGTLVAVDLASGEVRWEVPLGIIPELAGVEGADEWGSIFIGGPMITAGGLVFAAAGMDNNIRAFDIETGKVLWTGALPAGGQATPMTYSIAGKQYVVICAGGHGGLGTTIGDYVVAFGLPD
jgi:quinoprotein glucose dehydrogenase